MQIFFLSCVVLGGVVLAAQTLLGLLGLDNVAPDLDFDAEIGGSGVADGLDLLSVRSLAAGVAFYGVGGLIALGAGWLPFIAAGAAVVPGALAMFGTAYLSRQLLRLESDGSIRLENAIGAAGTVYLTIPAAGDGQGRIQLPLQGRIVELRAITRESQSIPTGAPIVVVDVIDGETVEVLPTPTVGGLLHGDA